MKTFEYLNWHFCGDLPSLTAEMDKAGAMGWEVYACSVIPSMVSEFGQLTYFISAKRQIVRE